MTKFYSGYTISSNCTISDNPANMMAGIADGFHNQQLHVIPLPIVEQEQNHPLIRSLYATAIGCFPRASRHYRARPEGCGEHILIVCQSGQGWFEIDGKRKPVRADQALYIPKGVPHVYGAEKDDPWTIRWLHILGDEADYYAACLPQNVYVIPLGRPAARELASTFKKAHEVIAHEYTQSKLVCLSQLARHLLSTLFFNNHEYSSLLRSSTRNDLRATITYIIAHSREPLTLNGLARHAGLSVRTFTRLFQHQTGMAPLRYVIQQRMRNACNLLVNTPLTVHEISAQVGYEDPYYFSRLFSKEIGHSPRQYRLTHLDTER